MIVFLKYGKIIAVQTLAIVTKVYTRGLFLLYAYNMLVSFVTFVNSLKESVFVFSAVVRAYSFPISFTSWFVAFLYSALNGGNLKYGVIALFGIIFLHAATNLFDDIVDFIIATDKIKKGITKDYDFQNAKCAYLRSGQHKLWQYFLLLSVLILIPLFSAIYFCRIYDFKLLYIIFSSLILCVLYPVLGCLGLGEVLVSVIFSPLLFGGVNFVMTGSFSFELFLISISTGLLAVAVLHNHMLLDFNCDEAARKITLCRLCVTKERALRLSALIITFAYVNIILFVIMFKSHFLYLLVLFTLPSAFTLYNVMKIHITFPDKEIKYNIFMGNVGEIAKVPDEQKNFLLKFLIARNLMNSFTLFLCIAMVLECILSKN